MELSM